MDEDEDEYEDDREVLKVDATQIVDESLLVRRGRIASASATTRRVAALTAATCLRIRTHATCHPHALPARAHH